MKAKSYCFLAALALIAAWLVTLPPALNSIHIAAPEPAGWSPWPLLFVVGAPFAIVTLLIVGASLWIAERVTA